MKRYQKPVILVEHMIPDTSISSTCVGCPPGVNKLIQVCAPTDSRGKQGEFVLIPNTTQAYECVIVWPNGDYCVTQVQE